MTQSRTDPRKARLKKYFGNAAGILVLLVTASMVIGLIWLVVTGVQHDNQLANQARGDSRACHEAFYREHHVALTQSVMVDSLADGQGGWLDNYFSPVVGDVGLAPSELKAGQATDGKVFVESGTLNATDYALDNNQLRLFIERHDGQLSVTLLWDEGDPLEIPHTPLESIQSRLGDPTAAVTVRAEQVSDKCFITAAERGAVNT
ncbi:MAG TPA: hypothetical protein VLF67_01000 [Candidatus Saccharimonas sp.]|nr:hypothetical protein [Candidatus Saccharimonas sp.]